MEAPPITFDQLPHVVSSLSEKLDRVLDLLEKTRITDRSKQSKPSRRLVYAIGCVKIGTVSFHPRADSFSTIMKMCVSDSFEYYRNNEICDEMKKKYGLTFSENKDKVKVDRLKGRSKTRQEIYLAVQAAKKSAKDWTTFQRELAQKGVMVRKKFRRGPTDVEVHPKS